MQRPYEKKLPVQYIDDVAKSTPSRLMLLIPKGKDPRDGFHEITFQHFARAVDHLALHLESKLGDKDSFHRFGFLSHGGDFRYMLLAMAAIKIGWVAFFPSPRNSMIAQLSVLDQAGCGIWLVHDEPAPMVAEMSKQRPLRFVQIPDETFFLTTEFDDSSPSYTYTKGFEEGRNDIFAILHTSGSTGMPKVVPQRQSLFSGPNALRALPKSNFQFNHFEGLRLFSPMPWFHNAPYMICFAAGMFYNVVSITPPACPLTAELVDLYHQYANIGVSLVPASILQEIVGNKSYLENCKKLKYIVNVGGPSTEKVGNILANYTHPLNIAGTTEMGMWSSQLLDKEDFMYWSFDPVSGTEFRPLDDKHFELWIVRDEKYRVYRPVFDTFPLLQEWSTKDVFTKHPTKPNLWRLVGRTDDVIVLSTGEKVNSVTIEGEIGGHPLIKGVVAFGEGQFELGLLLEIDEKDEREVRSSITPMLEQINRKTVAHGRISENMVILSSRDKPFPRAGKGTVQKKACLKLYEREIENAYARNTQLDLTNELTPVGNGIEEIAAYIEKWILLKTGFVAPARDKDIFDAGVGMDSLLVVRLSRELSSMEGKPAITPQDIYRRFTIAGLAAYVFRRQKNLLTNDQPDEQQIDFLLRKYSQNLPLNLRPTIDEEKASMTVAVTGTTGSLGSYLLHCLIEARPRVDKIYCLNRKAKAEAIKATTKFMDGFLSGQDHIEFLQIDVSQPRLGLDLRTYTNLAENVDIFIHNAWDVNFNKSIDSFEPHIHGVRQIIDLCACSQKAASLHFMSTVSTVLNWRPTSAPTATSKVPEQLYEDKNVVLRMGYAESKHVSERLLAQACEESNVSVAIYRLGQIAGPVSGIGNGCWPKSEWVPALIETSIALNTFPSDLGPMTDVDWIPIDVLGGAIVELALGNTTITAGSNRAPLTIPSGSTTSHALKVFHAVNPHVTSWSELLPVVLQHIPSNQSCHILSLRDWVARVKTVADSSVEDVNTLQDLPVMKMLPFFETLSQYSVGDSVHLDVTNTCAHSEILSSLGAVKPEWMRLWMEQWKFRVPSRPVGESGDVFEWPSDGFKTSISDIKMAGHVTATHIPLNSL